MTNLKFPITNIEYIVQEGHEIVVGTNKGALHFDWYAAKSLERSIHDFFERNWKLFYGTKRNHLRSSKTA